MSGESAHSSAVRTTENINMTPAVGTKRRVDDGTPDLANTKAQKLSGMDDNLFFDARMRTAIQNLVSNGMIQIFTLNLLDDEEISGVENYSTVVASYVPFEKIPEYPEMQYVVTHLSNRFKFETHGYTLGSAFIRSCVLAYAPPLFAPAARVPGILIRSPKSGGYPLSLSISAAMHPECVKILRKAERNVQPPMKKTRYFISFLDRHKSSIVDLSGDDPDFKLAFELSNTEDGKATLVIETNGINLHTQLWSLKKELKDVFGFWWNSKNKMWHLPDTAVDGAALELHEVWVQWGITLSRAHLIDVSIRKRDEKMQREKEEDERRRMAKQEAERLAAMCEEDAERQREKKLIRKQKQQRRQILLENEVRQPGCTSEEDKRWWKENFEDAMQEAIDNAIRKDFITQVRARISRLPSDSDALGEELLDPCLRSPFFSILGVAEDGCNEAIQFFDNYSMPLPAGATKKTRTYKSEISLPGGIATVFVRTQPARANAATERAAGPLAALTWSISWLNKERMAAVHARMRSKGYVALEVRSQKTLRIAMNAIWELMSDQERREAQTTWRFQKPETKTGSSDVPSSSSL